MRCFCSKDCPDTCSFDISLSPGGSPVFTPHQRPYTPRPFLCSKLRGFYDVEACESPRSFYMEAGRKIEAGSEKAIDKAAARIRRCENGRILYLRGSGSLSWRMKAWDALFARLDRVWFVDGNPCDETGIVAHKKDFSVCINPPVEQLEQADVVLLFGKNAKTVSPHFYVYLKALSEKGTRIVVIDPVQTGTSRIAERYIRIAPAGDGALAAGILSRLNLEPGLAWENLKYTAGVLDEDFEYLCSLFSQKKKIGIVTGFSLQRYSNGMMEGYTRSGKHGQEIRAMRCFCSK
ncbi:MAG: molybdopterin-dependent oxidoreductase, partial [Desulfosarcinaceae bacterium]